NPYIASSKLTPYEVDTMVLGLVRFNTYGEIATAIRRSPQALRPVLAQIERRMYFEFDGWPIFHLFQLSSYSLNRKHVPFINEIPNVIECVLRIPRAKNSRGLRTTGPELSLDAEVACLFNCPQHLPPNPFVERYGFARPIQNFRPHPLEQECHTRIGLKKSCSSCPGTLRDSTLTKKVHFFRYAMEYAARFGKPRHQYVDIFIARMAYALVWRAFDLNMGHFLAVRSLVHRNNSGNLDHDARAEYMKEMVGKDRHHAVAAVNNARKYASNLILDHLVQNPIRVDRRGAHKKMT
ncbi:MAG: hypothetical protein QM682_05055, partial [Paracoccus sp. (in: a-proteobacteria)]|uniref:hypothetical protein n=1 Tax=Paracoccus sp. TaxID=267 RepID=UPI0039E26F14